MKPSSFLIQSAIVTAVLLSVTFSNPIYSLSDPIDNVKNEGFSVPYEFERMGIRIRPNNKSLTEDSSPYFVGMVFSFAGFVSNLINIYKFMDSIANPVPKSKEEEKLEEIAKTMASEFSKVKVILDQVDMKLNQLQLQKFVGVEKAVSFALEDFRFKTPSDKLGDRPYNLFNELSLFMDGMLGDKRIYPDLLLNIRDVDDCGSSSMLKRIEDLITMVNYGVAGLTHYDKAIDKFNGEARVKELAIKYEAVRKRTQEVIEKCAEMSPSVIEGYITKILSRNLDESVATTTVSKKLYDRFANIYPNHINWVFYTAWKFNPVASAKNKKDLGENITQKNKGSYYIQYTGLGQQGVTKTGDWTVFWVGHPSSVVGETPAEDLLVHDRAIQKFVDEDKDSALYLRNAKSIGLNFLPSYFCNRAPVINMIFTDPPSGATFGTPLGKLNVWKKRMISSWQWPKNLVFKVIFVTEDLTVDVLIQ